MLPSPVHGPAMFKLLDIFPGFVRLGVYAVAAAMIGMCAFMDLGVTLAPRT